MKCCICDGGNIEAQYCLFDDRYGYPGNFVLYKCLECHHRFIDNSFSEKDLRLLYSNYYPRSNFSISDYEVLSFKKGFISWLNGENRSAYTYVPENVKVLDIGCGFGQSLGYHANRGCDVYGVEADNNILKVAERFSFNVKVGLFEADDYENEFFDYVTMDQVLEHTTNPIETLRGVYKVLKKDGTLIISIPNAGGWGSKFFGKKWINWHIPYHLQHFSIKSIKFAAEKACFDIAEIKTVTSSEWLYYQWLSLSTYPKIKEKSKFWSSCVNKSLYNRIFFKSLSMIHKIKINHIVTRFFDSIGCGDSFVIVLKRQNKLHS